MTPTRRTVLTSALAGGAALAASSTVSAHAERAAPVPPELRPGGEFDAYVAQLAKDDQFSGTVLLAHRSRPVLSRSHGMADASRSIPNGPNTIFKLASVTKCFTAVALGQLVQDDKADLHAPLGEYLDGFSAETAKVTLHQLLTHTAGLGEYAQSPEFRQGLKEWSTESEMMEGVLALIRKLETAPAFTPGTRHVYSNSGFFVLGAIVAAASNQPYHGYMREHVLAEAGMKRSNLYTRPQVLAGRDIAHPYWTQQSGERADFTTSEYFGFVGGPADGVYASAPDLLSFVGALTKGTLLSAAYTSAFTNGKALLSPTDKPVVAADARFYGYGFRDTITSGHRVWGHSGSAVGVATNLDVFPDLGWIAVVLSNYDIPITPIVLKARELITRSAPGIS
ncbi:serine hydrolase domain-containing protein [Nonomuraea guangzhouensis]|uniref:Serine hydrolase domain-containing protein n=1 Tax=Nonomuraea guangzhouensis TaxID=1291555 RepID=A0ABW4GF45_9ACTN|nr:serine hydrolase domain-containing protein [Nonomuraea guangzhouensis]